MNNDATADKYICSECFQDLSIQNFIKEKGERPGCAFCGKLDATTAKASDVFLYIRERIRESFTSDNSVDNFCVKEAKFHQDPTWGRYTSEQLLKNIIKIELPRDDNKFLFKEICDYALGDERWCSIDYGRLNKNQELCLLWDIFTMNVKHGRRFDLHNSLSGREFSPISIFNTIAPYIKTLIKPIPAGRLIYRVRKSRPGEIFELPDELGPPPPEAATQSNRMNPPGIPYFYGAETENIAMMEVGIKDKDTYSMGIFEVKRSIRVVDLFDLPEKVGYFANLSNDDRQGREFLDEFSKEISKPVSGDERTHLDYIPTQVFSELIRYNLGVHGIRYKSSHDNSVANIVLFISSNEVEGGKKRGILPDEVLVKYYEHYEIVRLSNIRHRS